MGNYKFGDPGSGAAEVDAYLTLVDVDFRTATNEDLSALGDVTISRGWGADGANVSVVLTNTGNGAADITANGLELGRTGTSGAGASVSVDLNGLLGADDSGLRIVFQIASAKTFTATDDRLQAWFLDKPATVSSPGRGILNAYKRFSSTDYGPLSTRYNDGNFTANYEVAGLGVDAFAQLEIRSTPKSYRVYYLKSGSDGLPAMSDMNAARTYGFLDGDEADSAIELRYVRLQVFAATTATTAATIERLWVLKSNL